MCHTRTRKRLETSSKKKKRNLFSRNNGIQASIHYLISIFLQNLEIKLNQEFSCILKQEEDFWKLKSRIQWLNEGDANTRFFHFSTLQRRRRNHITSLKDYAGIWTFDNLVIKDSIFQYFNSLFTTEQLSSLKTYTQSSTSFLSDANCLSLTRPLQDLKVVHAIKSFKPYKSPGPDGLHPFFYQHY